LRARAVLGWLGLFAAALSPVARADELAAGDLVMSQSGTYVARETGSIPAPGTAAGTANGIDHWMFLGADPVCMVMGTRFGFEYHLAHPLPGAAPTIEVMNDHPPMQLPDGRVVTHEQYDFHTRAGDNIAGYRFDHAYELVPGTWTFALAQDGRTLLRRTFEVVTNCNLPTS
jgi:hypothetical protein